MKKYIVIIFIAFSFVWSVPMLHAQTAEEKEDSAKIFKYVRTESRKSGIRKTIPKLGNAVTEIWNRCADVSCFDTIQAKLQAMQDSVTAYQALLKEPAKAVGNDFNLTIERVGSKELTDAEFEWWKIDLETAMTLAQKVRSFPSTGNQELFIAGLESVHVWVKKFLE